MAFYPPNSGGGGGGVSSINALTGAVTLSAGEGIVLTPVGNDISISSDVVLSTRVSIPSATVLTLGTPLLAISAPGVNQYIQVLQVQGVIQNVVTPYVDNLDLAISYGNNLAASGCLIAADIGAGAGERSLLEATADSFSQFDLSGSQINAAIATVVNAGVYITSGMDMFGTFTPGNTTLGDGDVEIIIVYKIIEL